MNESVDVACSPSLASEQAGGSSPYFTHLGISLVPRDYNESPGGKKPGHLGMAPFLRRRSTLAIPRKRGWLIFVYLALRACLGKCAPLGSPSR